MTSLPDWLREIGLEKYVAVFAENDVDFDVIRSLTEPDLEKLGLSLGHRRRLQQALAALDQGAQADAPPQTEPASVPTGPAPAPPGPTRQPGERRQLTVMFCDLADSTALAARLDPEQLREIIRAYQATCTEVVGRFDGHIAQYLGDGVLVYFGHPRAHEDDAQRAVHAALELQSSMGALNARHAAMLGARLSLRIGIHTGLVVVGGLDERQEQLAMGEAPNVAARLQALARPDGVVISGATRRLVEGIFSLRELGTVELKGLPEPVAACEVLGQTEAGSRLEAVPHTSLTPLVSRDLEVGLLMDRWEKACDGHGQVVLLSGEPGIGKSRLVQVLKERLAGEKHLRIEHRCSPYFQNTPFYPVIETLRRAFEWQRDDSDAVKLDKLGATLTRFGVADPEAPGLFAALLSVPTGERFPLPVMSPERQRARTLETLLHWVLRMADRQPVLYIIEDMHWVDASTLELLSLVVEQAPAVRMVALMTARPGFESPWSNRSHLTLVSLDRLTRRQSEQFVSRAAGGKALPGEVADHIVARADGVPLFLEELTRMLLESGRLKDAGDRYELASPLPASAIPTTLQDSLTARLDRLGKAKEVAQLGATLGRSFEFDLLQALAGTDADELATQLAELVKADILVQRGLLPNASFSFKHSLIQDAAYQSLLKSVRQAYHRRVADTLMTRFPAETEARPELLAHHLREAGDPLGAAAQWLLAGERATARCAWSEARAHLTAGLAGIDSTPQTSHRHRIEARLHLALGTVVIQSLFYTAPEVRQHFGRAYELSRAIDDLGMAVAALGGLWTYYLVTGQLDVAHTLAHDAIDLVKGSSQLPAIQMLLASSSFWLGRTREAQDLAEQALAESERPGSEAPTLYVGHYIPATMRVFLGMNAWVQGYPDTAVDIETIGARKGEQAGESFSEGMARLHLAYVHNLRREPEKAMQAATECIERAKEQGHQNWVLLASIHEAQAAAAAGMTAQAIPKLRELIGILSGVGDSLGVPHFKTWLAQALASERNFEEALTLLDEAIAAANRNTGYYAASQLRRIKGDVLLAMPSPDERQAEALLLEAIDIARQQEAKSFELQAALSLARLWQRNGKANEAREMLKSIYDWFTEGFDTPDLEEARGLLERLTHR